MSSSITGGKKTDFEKVIGEEQARLSRDFLSAEIESETNDILIELLGGPASKNNLATFSLEMQKCGQAASPCLA